MTLDCPNNRYVNDEKICQALAAMWAQIGVKVAVNAMPRATYFPKLEKTDTSMYMLGWGGGIDRRDLHAAAGAVDVQRQGRRRLQLRPLHQREARRADREDQGRHESRASGSPQIHEALLAHNAETNHIPLHRQVIPWATRSNVTAVHRADNNVIPYWVTIR